jgi:hypothetical protein
LTYWGIDPKGRVNLASTLGENGTHVDTNGDVREAAVKELMAQGGMAIANPTVKLTAVIMPVSPLVKSVLKQLEGQGDATNTIGQTDDGRIVFLMPGAKLLPANKETEGFDVYQKNDKAIIKINGQNYSVKKSDFIINDQGLTGVRQGSGAKVVISVQDWVGATKIGQLKGVWSALKERLQPQGYFVSIDGDVRMIDPRKQRMVGTMIGPLGQPIEVQVRSGSLWERVSNWVHK